MIGKMISHYKILGKLGEGGMGLVYKAEDTQLKRLVALKFLPPHISESPEEKARLLHEAQSASALNHPNVTTIYGIEENPEGIFIAMEYIEGKTIKEILEKETLSMKRTLEIAIQVCEGLTAAHKKGIVHRDIKSDNIMVTKEGQAKIMDFGLAKLKGASKLTETDSTLGTAAYMSPEQASGEEVDQRSDIFSFGVVLYELLAGQLPFEGEHQAAIIYSILNEEPQPVTRFNSQISAKLEDIVCKALAKEKEDRYQHIDDLLADLRRERKSLEYVKTAQIPPEAVTGKPRRKLLPFIVPASIVFILVLLFFILNPFKVEISTERGAIAQENSLAIMYFENMADPEDRERFGEMITSLLITDLSESQYMRVVSRQRLYDISKLLGKEDLKVIDRTVASEVAEKAGVKWILTGSILQIEPNIILASDISEASTGNILATQRVTGERAEDLFSVVDKLSAEIKEDLPLPEQAKSELDRPVADVTTHSAEAYRQYLKGLDYFYKIYYPEAKENFKRALAFDSTFAMAYYRLATLEGGTERKNLLAKALKYSDNVSQKERHYIKSLVAIISGDYAQGIKELQKIVKRHPEEKEAFYLLGAYYRSLGNSEETIRQLKKAIEIDPLYKDPYNLLAYSYDHIGNFDKSIWAINKYISLAPDEANPYDSRADLYAYNGKIDKAIESYKKALEIKPDFYASLGKLGHMYLFKREYAKAESCYRELSSSREKDTRSAGRIYLALISLRQGKLERALEVLDHGIAADRMEGAERGTNATKRILKAFIFVEQKKFNVALKETEIGMEILKESHPEDPVNMRDFYVGILAGSGKIARAEDIARALKEDIAGRNPVMMYRYWQALGSIELAKGNREAAVTYLERANEEAPVPLLHLRVLLAQAYLKSGRLGEAVAELERALSRYDENRATFSIFAVKAHYLLGIAYEKSGWNKKAVEQYEQFLDVWKNSDPGIAEVEDATRRLKELKVEG